METLKLSIDGMKELIKLKFRQTVARPDDRVRPIFIEGHTGIGKTQLVAQCAEELTRELSAELKGEPVRCRVLNLQFCERPDFMGLPYVTAEGESAFAKPILLPREGFGLYFLDEANRVERDIRSGMLTLLEDRNVNGHPLGPGWLPVLAGNPGDGETGYEVTEFDAALNDRVARVVLVGDAKRLIAYLKEKYGDHLLVRFLQANWNFVSFEGKGISPRAFEYAIRATLHEPPISNDALFRVLASELGVEGARLVHQLHMKSWVPDYASVITGSREAFQFLNANTGRQDVMAAITASFLRDLDCRLSGEGFSDEEVQYFRVYWKLLKDEQKLAVVHGLRTDRLQRGFHDCFARGTEIAEFVARTLDHVLVAPSARPVAP